MTAATGPMVATLVLLGLAVTVLGLTFAAVSARELESAFALLFPLVVLLGLVIVAGTFAAALSAGGA